MKKNTKAQLGFALGFVVIITLVTIAFSKKPPTPEDVWGAQIPAWGNLSGMIDEYPETHLYSNADPNVRVSVIKSMTGTTVDFTSIKLSIYANATNDTKGDPLETYVSFSNAYFPELVQAADPGPLGWCGFPPYYNIGGSQSCLLYFLNSNHPKEGYEHILFSFRIDADLEDETLFPKSQRVKYLGLGSITIYIWNSFEAITLYDPFPYHTVTMNLAHMCNDGEQGYYITRLDDNKWELNLVGQTLEIRQNYQYEEVTGTDKRNRPIITRTAYVPQSGLVDLSYKFVIIKNPK